jgi:hypothetical protein
MDAFLGLMFFLLFIGGLLLLLTMKARIGLSITGMKMRRAIPAQWNLQEFLKLKPSRWKRGEYYLFSEETVRSLGQRYIGRFDSAILHWEEVPVLDLMIEYKFPVNYLPEQSRPEDVFQAGLYALALLESGVSCSNTRLVTIYCLQDRAMKCMEGKSSKSCWRCGDSKVYTNRFNPRNMIKTLKRLDEIWYKGRNPRPAKEPERCRPCPYSKDKCNYSVV